MKAPSFASMAAALFLAACVSAPADKPAALTSKPGENALPVKSADAACLAYGLAVATLRNIEKEIERNPDTPHKEREYQRATALLEMAMEHGHPDAFLAAGLMIATGRGKGRDVEQGQALIRMAAFRGSRKGQETYLESIKRGFISANSDTGFPDPRSVSGTPECWLRELSD